MRSPNEGKESASFLQNVSKNGNSTDRKSIPVFCSDRFHAAIMESTRVTVACELGGRTVIFKLSSQPGRFVSKISLEMISTSCSLLSFSNCLTSNWRIDLRLAPETTRCSLVLWWCEVFWNSPFEYGFSENAWKLNGSGLFHNIHVEKFSNGEEFEEGWDSSIQFQVSGDIPHNVQWSEQLSRDEQIPSSGWLLRVLAFAWESFYRALTW